MFFSLLMILQDTTFVPPSYFGPVVVSMLNRTTNRSTGTRKSSCWPCRKTRASTDSCRSWLACDAGESVCSETEVMPSQHGYLHLFNVTAATPGDRSSCVDTYGHRRQASSHT